MERILMKQVLRRGFSEIVVETLPDPVPAKGQVLVRNLYSLISSGTETASIHQHGVLKAVADNPSHLRTVWNVLAANGPLPTLAELKARFSAYAVLGYSGAGIVVGKHSSVTDIELGQRVAYGGEGTGHGEVIAVSRNLIARVPEGVELEHACFTTLGAIAMNAVRVSSIGLGETVVVLGLGLVGQLITQLLRCQGAQVIGVDLRPERTALAQQLGAEATVCGGDVRGQVLGLTGGAGADHVMIAAASKSPAVAQSAVDLVRDRGRIVVVGAVPLELPWLQMYLKETELRMSRAYGPGSYDPLYEVSNQDYPLPYVRWTENRNMEEFLRLVEKGQVRLQPLITHRYPLEQAAQAYETILSPGSTSLAVTLEYEAASQEDPLTAYQPQRRVEVSPPAPNKSLKVALLGAGNIAKWAHLPALRKTAGLELLSVQSSKPARTREYAERFGAQDATTDMEALLQRPELDAVLITNRNPLHARAALAALRAGKHVFVEKPMALTVEECRALVEAQAKSRRVLFVGFNRRFAPLYQRLKQAVKQRSGPAQIHCRVNSPGISGSYWMADPSAGGAILGEACHFTDLFYWLLESEPVSVAAHSFPIELADPIGENNLCATFRFADGSIASLTYGTAGSATSGGERVEVFASGFGAGVEDFKRFWHAGQRRTEKSFWFAQKGYEAQMQAFASALAGREAPAVNVADGARATLCCLQMLAAARSGQAEPVHLQGLLSGLGDAGLSETALRETEPA
jgi:predicted dehydrogenase/threonine dehydrogenase-like Zn-dependent dehydrogenase